MSVGNILQIVETTRVIVDNVESMWTTKLDEVPFTEPKILLIAKMWNILQRLCNQERKGCHGRQPVREWPAAFWPARSYPRK